MIIRTRIYRNAITIRTKPLGGFLWLVENHNFIETSCGTAATVTEALEAAAYDAVLLHWGLAPQRGDLSVA